MDLFDDLPEPTNTNKPLSNGSEVLSKLVQEKLQDKGVKRKQELNECIVDSQPEKRVSQGFNFTLKHYVKERKGEREDMQDAHSVVESLVQDVHCSVHRVSFYGVFDGHGGSRASQFAANHLCLNIAAKFPKGDVQAVERDIRKCFIEAFKKTDDEFLKLATRSKPSWKDGTTVVAVLVINNTLYIANLGDSKAILARFNEELGKAVAIPLTTDHTPTQYEERMRIQKAGGKVRDGRVMGILEISRSIGDGQFKTCGITCVPDVKRCQLTQNDRFIILACDGLWKVFTPAAAMEFVTDILKEENIIATNVRTAEEVRYDTAATKLANEAIRRGSSDNITVLILSININK